MEESHPAPTALSPKPPHPHLILTLAIIPIPTPTRTLTLTLSPARARARAQARSLILPNPDAYQVLPFCAMVYEGVKGKVGAHRAPSRPIRMLSTLRCGMAKLGKEGDRSLNTEPFLDPR